MGRSSSSSTSDPALEAEQRRALNENIAAIRDRVGSSTEDIFRRYGIRRALGGSSGGGGGATAKSPLSGGPLAATGMIFQRLGLGKQVGGILSGVGKLFSG